MKLLLGGILTNEDLYKKYFADFTIETYEKFYLKDILSYVDIVDDIYNKYFVNKQYETIVGHSMGGIIILELLFRGYNIQSEKIIICESYLKEPSEPFRNLVFNNPTFESEIFETMKKEEKRFNPAIFNSLRKLDITDKVKKINRELHFVYGSRDMNIDEFKNALDFPKSPWLHVHEIPKTSHFALLEDYNGFSNLLSTID